MDNFHIDVTSEGRATLELALRLAFSRWAKATHYYILSDQSDRCALVLRWMDGESRKSSPLPYALTADTVTEFVWRWLEQCDYGREPDHDGSNGKGWHVWCDQWGHIGSDHYAFVAIEARWAMYGK